MSKPTIGRDLDLGRREKAIFGSRQSSAARADP
jgi:hypothetical protein